MWVYHCGPLHVHYTVSSGFVILTSLDLQTLLLYVLRNVSSVKNFAGFNCLFVYERVKMMLNRMCECVCVCVCVCTRICACVLCVCVCVCVRACMHACLHMHTCMHRKLQYFKITMITLLPLSASLLNRNTHDILTEETIDGSRCSPDLLLCGAAGSNGTLA